MLCIVIPWRHTNLFRSTALARVLAHFAVTFPETPVTLADDGGDPFSRSGSIRAGVEASDSDVVIICDADLIVPLEQLTEAVRQAREAPGLVLPFDRYLYLTQSQTDQICRDENLLLPSKPVWEWDYRGSVGGCGVISRESFDACPPDPRFRGWGHEDSAWNRALETLIAPTRRVPGDMLHLWHPIDPTNSPGPQLEANKALDARYAAAEGDREAMAALVR